ncbi:MAG: rod shape-determining protein MreC [Candidatus Staskawiczbacteria bacterium RIFCSPLOWO2_01_FULL_40_39]|uniref:Cell shape-determining protein MreC n=1 Tax=Candidatus Staskawiczbacteria bacterium RIFCSPHIGHO2_01_FULL_39_25 TaxID=1802202 RepID=A0A1G2HPW1_9BACT|nr:MAG: rod shape-determining protein MreC [Candidatus Staskawiczbacteria bacterium RIFCSPHIGHO2_01_FULL_39_25]OGZ72867.1 MAG: rod shape-determining protein MreC [Candidatus Staskawiczbacteria bacterium RIFCSPLOWO2_01_FULL_40_39]OGZ75208.1 MAG: rod shape-determining protein MreC [Candidatus Staskawiczbacteria bacterium RIFCSPLOWO2_02_FULL_39_8]
MNIYTKKQNFLLLKTIIVIIVFLTLAGSFHLFEDQIKNYSYRATSPIAKVFWRAGDSLSMLSKSFAGGRWITEENNNLKEENQKLLSEISSLKEKLQENQAIGEFLQNTQNDHFETLLASVVGVDYANDVILIDKGSDDGIEENMPVISSQKVIYGKVLKVYKNFSNVMMVSNKNSVLDVKIQDGDVTKPPIYGAIKGNGNLSFYLDLVSLDAQIKEGDTLVSSALEGIFPKDLLVGKVLSINKDDLKPFQTARVQPFFDIKNIDSLFVITDYKKEK